MEEDLLNEQKQKLNLLLEKYGLTEKAQLKPLKDPEFEDMWGWETYYEGICWFLWQEIKYNQIIRESRSDEKSANDFLQVAYIIQFLNKVLKTEVNRKIPEITISTKIKTISKPIKINSYYVISSIVEYLGHLLYDNRSYISRILSLNTDNGVYSDEQIQQIIDLNNALMEDEKVFEKRSNVNFGCDAVFIQQTLYEIGFFNNIGIKGKGITKELSFLFDLLGIMFNFETDDYLPEDKYRNMKDWINAFNGFMDKMK